MRCHVNLKLWSSGLACCLLSTRMMLRLCLSSGCALIRCFDFRSKQNSSSLSFARFLSFSFSLWFIASRSLPVSIAPAHREPTSITGYKPCALLLLHPNRLLRQHFRSDHHSYPFSQHCRSLTNFVKLLLIISHRITFNVSPRFFVCCASSSVHHQSNWTCFKFDNISPKTKFFVALFINAKHISLFCTHTQVFRSAKANTETKKSN